MSQDMILIEKERLICYIFWQIYESEESRGYGRPHLETLKAHYGSNPFGALSLEDFEFDEEGYFKGYLDD